MKLSLKKISIVFFLCFFTGIFSLSLVVMAASGCPSCTPVGQDPGNYCNPCPPAQLDNCKKPCQTYSGQLENPLGSETLSPTVLYGRLIYAFLGITGALALVMFVVGGFQWMTAAGNAERVKKGRDTLMWAVLGLLVIFSSYAILRAVFEALQF